MTSQAYNSLFSLDDRAESGKVAIASQALKAWEGVAKTIPGPDWRRNAAFWQTVKIVNRAFPKRYARGIVEARASWY
jgi:hypothetical protein